MKQKLVNRRLKSRRLIIATSTFCTFIYINHLTFFTWDVPRHITPTPNKNKKDFMQVRPKLTKGQAKHLELTPDIPVVIVCSTDQPSGAGSLRCRLGKTKVIMNGRMISHILKNARVQQQATSARNALKVAPNSVSFSLLIRWQVGTKLDLLQVDLSWRAEGVFFGREAADRERRSRENIWNPTKDCFESLVPGFQLFKRRKLLSNG